MEEKVYSKKPNEGDSWDVVIIGSGPAALTAAVYTTRGAASTLVLAGASWGGQLMLTSTVDNFPGFEKGVLGPDLMGKMRSQAERFGAEIVEKDVTDIKVDVSPFEILVGEEKYLGKSVIVATGAENIWLGVEGESKLMGRGVSACAPCDAPFFKDKDVAVIGGGDSAMEEALILTKYANLVSIIHRRDEFRASTAMQEKIKQNEKISTIWNTEVEKMLGEQKLEALVLKTALSSKQAQELKTGSLNSLNVKLLEEKSDYLYWQMSLGGVFVAIGHKPTTDVFKGKIDVDEKGYAKRLPTNEKKAGENFFSATSVPGIFVAGDVHDSNYKQAVTAAGFGCMAGLDTLKYLDKPTPSW